MSITSQLLAQHCAHQVDALKSADIDALLPSVPDWHAQGACIVRSFAFKDYHATLGFVDAIAPVIHAENHHPEIVLTYNRCIVKFDTHSVDNGRGGLSINDFICAARVDAIFQQLSVQSPG